MALQIYCFTKKNTPLIWGGDERAGIAIGAEKRARASGITDEAQLMGIKGRALERAGFAGENYYAKTGEEDPVLKRAVESAAK